MGRITWTDERTRKLLLILKEEKDRGYSKHNWANIAKILNAQTGLSAHGKQVQNHHGYLKEKFKSWEELQHLSGITYNPITKDVDVDEKCLERWGAFLERNARYGLALAKKQLANVDLLTKLFAGQTAHGVGGCFSSGMARGASYFSRSVENLSINENEGSGYNEEDRYMDNDRFPYLSVDEGRSPPRSLMREASHTASFKRKSEETIDFAQLKRRQSSFDIVIQLLSRFATGSSGACSKAQMVSDALTRMEVSEKRGDEYFVSAIRYLSEQKHADNFLALENDNQRWIYLKGVDVDPRED